MSISETIRRLLKLKKIKKENIVSFGIFLIIFSAIFISAKIFDVDIGPIIFISVFSILCLMVWIMAGIAVFRSLLLIGAGLSLMIFLTQSYCGLSGIDRTANDALKSLFGFGLICIIFLFIKSLYKELTKGLKDFWEIYKDQKFGYWIVIILFVIFVGLFVWQLYQVMKPIILGLCIYK